MDKEALRQQLDTEGLALQPVWGGPKKKRYYTPDGREVWAIPAIREYARKDAQGKVVETGTRDANYDKGWLETRPIVLKPYCKGCDRWHDTPQEIAQCVKSRKAERAAWEKEGQKQLSQDQGNGLEAKVEKLTEEVGKLSEVMAFLLEREKKRQGDQDA